MAKKQDAASALVTVISAIEPLTDDEKRWVLQSAASRWTLNVQLQSAVGGTAGQTQTGAGVQPVVGTPGNVQDPKAFVKQKDPQRDTQRVACLAYYLTHAKKTPAFKTRDITQANTDAKGSRFHIPRAVANASRSKCGYLSAVGGAKKQLSAYGEEIVEALPNQEAVKALEDKYKKGRRRRGRKSTRKA